MSEDPYAKTAKGYDSVVEPFVRKLRTIGMKMFPLHRGVSVLDVGCGTGTHLDIYQKTGCRVFGIDSSPAMLDVAQMKLAGRAKLHLGDASRMPFPDESFDLVQAVLVLHEMPAPIRSLVVDEAKRVMKKNGRFLLAQAESNTTFVPKPQKLWDIWWKRSKASWQVNGRL